MDRKDINRGFNNADHIRYHITAILAVHWLQFVAQYNRWIRPVVFEKVFSRVPGLRVENRLA